MQLNAPFIIWGFRYTFKCGLTLAECITMFLNHKFELDDLYNTIKCTLNVDIIVGHLLICIIEG